MLGFGCRILAFDGREIFVLHFQHDVDGRISELIVELLERLQLDRVGMGAESFAGSLLGVVDFLLSIRFFPCLFGFGDPILVGASRKRRVDGMVQVILNGRDLESVRQFQDVLDVVELIVVLDD